MVDDSKMRDIAARLRAKLELLKKESEVIISRIQELEQGIQKIEAKINKLKT